MTTVKECLLNAAALKKCSSSPRLDCEILLAHVLDVDRGHLYAWPEKALTEVTTKQFEALFQRRLNGEPIAYLTGYKEFWSLPLAVNSSTLIPRPETELIVELVLEKAQAHQGFQAPVRALDLGSGSGAIALAIASEKPKWDITAVDNSAGAMRMAQLNQQRLGFHNITFMLSDWFSGFEQREPERYGFDFVLANPPYIDSEDPHLQRGDVRFEPRSALVAGDSGLKDLIAIINQSRRYMRSGSWLILEHGYQQSTNVLAAMRAAGYQDCATHSDFAGLPRASCGQFIN